MSGRRRRHLTGGEQQRGSSTGTGRDTRSTSTATSEERGGILGWASRAGDWVGEKWDDATETVGGWVDDAQAWAGDIKDVVVGTDVDWGALTEGRLDVETDLDEIADVLPARLAEQFQLDREGSENKVGVSIDHNAGTITLRSDQIALLGLNLDAVQAGATDLRDLEIVLTDPDGELGYFDGLTDLDSYDVKVTIGGADVTDLVLNGEGGQTSIQDASLSELSFAGTRGENGLAAEIGLGSAEVRGLAGSTTADALAIEGVKGSLSGNGEQGRLAVERLQADGLVTEKGSGSAAIEGLTATVDNKGGGLPFLDAQQDALKANVSIDAANVRDLDSEAADLGYLDLLGADVAYDQRAGTVNGSLQSAELEGLTGPAGVDRASVDGADFDLTLGRHLDLDVERLAASGVRLPQKSAQGGDTGGGAGSGGMTIGADVGNVDLNDLSLPGGVHLDGVSGTDVGFAKNGTGLTATANQASARGVTAGDMRIDGAIGSGVIFGKQGDSLDLNVADVQATGFSHGDVSVASAQVQGADVSVDPSSLDARATMARVDGASFKGVGVESFRADDIALQRDRASGDVGATIAAVQVGGLDTEKQDAGQVDLAGVDFRLQDGQGTVGIDQVAATDFSSGSFGAGGLEANNATATFGSGVREGRGGVQVAVDDAALSAWSVGGKIGAERSTARGVQLGAGNGELDLDVASGSSTNLQAGEVSLGSLAFDDLDLASRREDQSLDLALGDASFSDLDANGAAVDSGNLSGLSLQQQGGKDGTQQIGIDGIGAQGIAVDQQGQSIRVGGVDATGLAIDRGPDGLDVELGSLDARQLALHKQGGSNGAAESGSSSGGPAVDVAALVRSGTALIDDVDLSAQVGLNQGELGPVKVEEGTVVDGRVVIEDGRLTSDTGFDLSRPLDAPLWTTVNGAYVDERERLKVDMGGLWDINAGKKLNQQLGVDGKSLASVADYGAAVADGMGNGTQDTGASSDKASQPIVDAGSLSVNGQVALNAGQLDAGIGNLTLEERLAVDVAMQGGDVSASIERLNTAAIAVATGDSNLAVADADLHDARLLLDQNNGDLDATLEQIRLEGLKFSRE